MKLRNKKTGKITTNYDLRAFQGIDIDKGIDRICLQTENGNRYAYSSLAELNEEWEDYEETKEYWYIGYKNIVRAAEKKFRSDYADNDITEKRREIGNYFETKEEAEKAVEKLKAWKRLKDSGVIDLISIEMKTSEIVEGEICTIRFHITDRQVETDLKLLFGGGE